MGEPLEPLFQEEKDLSEAKVMKKTKRREGGISFGPDTHSSFFFFSPFNTWKL